MDEPQTILNPQVIRMHTDATAAPGTCASHDKAETQPGRDYISEMADLLIKMGNAERMERHLADLGLLPPDPHIEEVKRRLIDSIAHINAARNAPRETVNNYYLGEHTGQFLAGGNVYMNQQITPHEDNQNRDQP